MSRAVITEKVSANVVSVNTSDSTRASFVGESYDASFSSELQKLRSVKLFSYFRSKVFDKKNSAKTFSDLPFRVRFINIGIESYGPNNPPPIGIAVIGLNNYIL
jgi:hypothetical protein